MERSINKIVNVAVSKNNKPFRGLVSFYIDGENVANRRTNADGEATYSYKCSQGPECNRVIRVEVDGVGEDQFCSDSAENELDFDLDI
jgi:hypothetical protein